MSRIAHIFFDADLRCSHIGLKAFLEKEKIEVAEKDFVVFLNRSRTMFKIYMGRGDLLIHFNNGGKAVNPEVIPLIPTYFSGSEFKYKAALRRVLEKKLKRKKN